RDFLEEEVEVWPRETKKWFGVLTFNDRTRQRLVPIIANHIREGTLIVSDKFSAYVSANERNTLANNPALARMGYSHMWVNYSRNFVNPVNGAHTQDARCSDQPQSYLDMFMWRSWLFPTNATGMLIHLFWFLQLLDCNDHMIGQYVRVLVAVCLQKFSAILAHPDVWAFSIIFDGSTHRGTSFFDVRLRVCVDGVLQNFHLVAHPMFERHTSNNYVALIVKLHDALYIHWRLKLIGVSSDGENVNTGGVQGVVTQLVAMAEFPVDVTFQQTNEPAGSFGSKK
ncbi:hypothetical protein LEN26_009173, partial [Aphanomyces euteiches]